MLRRQTIDSTRGTQCVHIVHFRDTRGNIGLIAAMQTEANSIFNEGLVSLFPKPPPPLPPPRTEQP